MRGRALTVLAPLSILDPMDASLIEGLIHESKAFRVQTASGGVFHVPHRDFVSFTPRKTSLLTSCEEEGKEHFPIVPLFTATAALAATARA